MPAGVTWSAHAVRTHDGEVVASENAGMLLPSASAAKIVLLLAVARGIETRTLDPAELVDRGSVPRVADSGLWHRLAQERMPLDDAARLVGAVSDNLATNVLIARMGGIAAIADAVADYGIDGIELLDVVRDVRTAAHAPTLSHGTALAYATLVRRIHHADGIPAAVCRRVRDWLSDNTDLSMVAGAFGFDPLAHRDADRDLALWNKTGTDVGTRVDVGVVACGDRAIAYACLVRWDPAPGDAERDAVLAGMRDFGARVRAALA